MLKTISIYWLLYYALPIMMVARANKPFGGHNNRCNFVLVYVYYCQDSVRIGRILRVGRKLNTNNGT